MDCCVSAKYWVCCCCLVALCTKLRQTHTHTTIKMWLVGEVQEPAKEVRFELRV